MTNSKIEALVSRAASNKTNSDYDELFLVLRGIELFFNVNGGGGANASPVSIPIVDAGSGFRAVLFFTSNESKNLKKPFGGLVWEKALEMVIKINDADGLIIQNNEAAWVGVDKIKAKALLDAMA
jgi:hypothetical protein